MFERMLVHLADIGHPLRPWAIHFAFSQRVTEEFFRQGDEERRQGHTPMVLFDREQNATDRALAKSQVGFINFVVIPAWSTFADVRTACGCVYWNRR